MFKMKVVYSLPVFVGLWSFAFSGNNPSEMQLPPGSPDANAGSESQIRFNRYNAWNYANLFPLACEAQKNGLSATQEEIEAQKSIIKSIYGVAQISDNLATNEILARKYAQSMLNIKPTQGDKEIAYRDIVAGASDAGALSKEELASLIETRAIVNCPVIKNELSKILDRNEKMRVKSENMEQVWPLNDLKIHSSDDACIARHPDSANCQLTVKRFNNLIKYQTFPKIFPLDTARRIAINNMLTDDYLAVKARQKGFARSETASEDIKGWLKWSTQNSRMKKSGKIVTDKDILHAVYGQYYRLLFSQKATPYCSLIGSSDSFAIDSIAYLFAQAQLKRQSRDTNAVKDTLWKSALPWSRSSAEMLPDELQAAVDTMPCGSVSKAIRTPYGAFLVRIDSMVIRPEILFEEAHDKVVALATKEKWLNFDQAIADTAFRIYSSNASLYQARDTLSLVFMLKMNPRGDAIAGLHAVKPKSKKELRTEVARKGMKISSAHLPTDILDSLMAHYEKSYKKGFFFGPIASRYGTWHFIMRGVRAGTGKIPFSIVKKRLIDSLIVSAIDSGECAAFEKPDSLLAEMSLARVYAPRFFEQDDASEDEKAEAAKKADSLGAKNPDWYYESKVAEIQLWIDKMTIRIP
jgi:hypothetical protein